MSSAQTVCVQAAIGALFLGLGGCATPVERRPAAEVINPPADGNDGGAIWESVLPGAEVSGLLAQRGHDPESWDARLDDDLNARPAAPLLATAQWPEPVRPSLARARRIYIADRETTFVFYGPEDGWARPRALPAPVWTYWP